MKTALITGASKGIGKELARLFAADGYSLVLTGRDEADLNTLATELSEQHPIKTYVVAVDLAKKDAHRQIISYIEQQKLEIDTLVNSAGFGYLGEFEQSSSAVVNEMLQVDITALVDLTHHFLHQMKKRNAGQILNMSSLAGFVPGPDLAIYHAAKAFVLSFSEALNEELKHTGITVTVICPGVTDTNFASRAGMEKTNLSRYFPIDTPQEVAKKAYAAMQHHKRVKVIGFFNSLVALSLKLSPTTLNIKISKFLNKIIKK